MNADFQRAYEAWRQRVDRDRRLRLSSVTSVYTSLPEYRAIARLGRDVLPDVMEMVDRGDFLLNDAAFELAGIGFEDVVPDPDGFYSEQDISRFLLNWWAAQRERVR